MRKTFVLTLLLALLAVGSIGYVASEIYPLRNQVTVQATQDDRLSYGDVSAAKGLVAYLKADYYKAMNWHTKVHFGEKLTETHTDYTLAFPVQKTTSYLREREDIDIRVTVEDVIDSADLAYMAEGLKQGERREEQIFLKEYADFYNIEVDILFPEVTYAWRPYGESADNEMEAALKTLFDENFRFPIGEYVSVDAHGDVGRYGPGYGYGVNESSSTFGLEVIEVFLENRAYFAFDRNGEMYQDLDVSHLPLGYGIYCVTVPEDGGQPTLVNVHSLQPDVEILKLAADDAGNILAYMVEKGMLFVTVIDAKTNTATQQLALMDFPSGVTSWATYEADRAVAVTLAHAEPTCRLALLTMGEDGFYRLRWNLEVPSERSYLLTYSDEPYKEYVYDYAPVMAWNGQYLALGICAEYWSNFDLALYDENGLVYYDKYLSSLNIWPIEPDGDVPLRLEWE